MKLASYILSRMFDPAKNSKKAANRSLLRLIITSAYVTVRDVHEEDPIRVRIAERH